MFCAAVRTRRFTDWHFPLLRQGDSCLRLEQARRSVHNRDEKTRLNDLHRPASNASKALLDSPGRAARKPAGNEASVSGTELLLLPKIHGGSGSRETSFQYLLLSFWTRKTSFQQPAWEKCLCRRICLEVDCRSIGLEANQDNIKLLHRWD